MITQPMTKEAVTGTASPSRVSATAASSAVSASTTAGSELTACAPLISSAAACGPRPVLVVVAVMMPAAAQTALTASTPRTPELSAWTSRAGVSRCRRSRKESAAARTVAPTTAFVAERPRASSPVITSRERKW